MSDYTPTTDDLANEIRRVDGSHSLGAGALAEALGSWLAAHDAEVRCTALAEQAEQGATAEARYPMPERDDYETQTDWVTAVVMVQGKRQGWIDAHAALAEQGTEERAQAMVDMRDPECVKAWPECETFGNDPRCCRFPKTCSAGSWVHT